MISTLRRLIAPGCVAGLVGLIALFAAAPAWSAGGVRVEWMKGQTVLAAETVSSTGASVASAAAPSFGGTAGSVRLSVTEGAVIVHCCATSPVATQTNGIRLQAGDPPYTIPGVAAGARIAVIEATQPPAGGGGGSFNGVLAASTATIGDVGTASFSATCATLTLPGSGGGAYASGDLIANSATAGSVVPVSCTVARYAAGPVTITRASILTSTTGVSNATFRVHAYTGTPTVTNGNDGAFVSSGAGHFCRLDVTVDQVFTDGARGAGAPTTGNSCTRALASGQAVNLLLEARAAYTWTNSMTFTVTLEGFN